MPTVVRRLGSFALVLLLTGALVAQSARVAEASAGIAATGAAAAASAAVLYPPVITSTMSGITLGSGAVTAATGVAAVGTVATVGTVLLVAAAAAAVGYGIYKGAQWLFDAGVGTEEECIASGGKWLGDFSTPDFAACHLDPLANETTNFGASVSNCIWGGGAGVPCYQPGPSGQHLAYTITRPTLPYWAQAYRQTFHAKGDASWCTSISLGTSVTGGTGNDIMSGSQATCFRGTGLAKIEIIRNGDGQVMATVNPDPDGGPAGKITVDGQCEASGTGATYPVTAASESYSLKDLPPDIPVVQCAPGDKLLSATGTNTSTVAPPRPMFDYEAPIVPQQQQDLYPDCLKAGKGPCELALVTVNPDTGEKTKCADAPSGACVGWADDANRENSKECHWGPYVLALEQCAAHVPYPATTPIPVNVSTPTLPAPTTAPEFQPDAAPGTSAPPAPEDNPDPQSDPEGNTGDCANLSAWSILNPFAAYRVIGCALQKAFVPSQATAQRVNDITVKARGRAPVAQIAQGATWIGTATGGGTATGCLNFTIDLASLGNHHVLNSCNKGHPIVAQLHKWRGLLEVALYLAFFGPLLWWAWRQYAPGSTGVA